MTTTYSTEINKALARLGTTNGTKNPDERHNTGALLGDAYLWQQVSDYADTKLKSSKAALEANGIVPNKEALRSAGRSEAIIAESPTFAFVAKVAKPQERFNRDEFITRVAKKFKLKEAELRTIALASTKTTEAPVSTSIVEKN
jgi:hypothetical protein